MQITPCNPSSKEALIKYSWFSTWSRSTVVSTNSMNFWKSSIRSYKEINSCSKQYFIVCYRIIKDVNTPWRGLGILTSISQLPSLWTKAVVRLKRYQSFTPNHWYAYTPYSSPYFSLGDGLENLFNNQDLL